LAVNREFEILALLMAQARTAMGEELFKKAEDNGLAMGYAEGVAEVRAWLSKPKR
jgi:hypothetical protein